MIEVVLTNVLVQGGVIHPFIDDRQLRKLHILSSKHHSAQVNNNRDKNNQNHFRCKC